MAPPQEQRLDPALHQVLRQQAKLRTSQPPQNAPQMQQIQKPVPQNTYMEPVEDTDVIQPMVEEKQSIFKKWWFWLVLALIILGIAGAAAYFLIF